jgi:predicted cobalt transporter CbtA
MPLKNEIPPAIRYLVPGAVAGIVSFAFSRVMIEPLIGAAVDYEAAREHAESQLTGGDHEHGHELFTRAVQENVGAAVGVVSFGIIMGVLFAVAYAAIRTVLERRSLTLSPTGLALLLSTGMFMAIVLMPSLKYPVLLPSFDEVPGPLNGPDGLVLDGFPIEVLADFRLYSLVNQALMWLVIGATSACLMKAWPSMRRRHVMHTDPEASSVF